MSEYIPGVCNIGKAEVERRKSKFKFSIFLLLVASIVYLWFDDSTAVLGLQIVLACYSSILFFQIRQKFCIAFGWFNLYNFGELNTKKQQVSDNDYRQKDRLQVARILTFSLISTLIYIGLIFLLKRII